MIHLDVESFSLLSVRGVGAWRYWEDPSTETLCACWAYDDEQVVHEWRRGQPVPAHLAERIERGDLIGAHNAQFERLAFLKDLGPRCGFPVPKLRQWRCTAAQAAALALPRALDKALAALGSVVRKDKRGPALIKRFCMPRKPTKGDPGMRIYPWEDPAGFDELVSYCAQDVRGERVLFNELPKLPPSEERVWQLDTRINERGLPIDMDLVDKMITVADERIYELDQQVAKLTGGLRPTQREKVLDWIKQAGGDVDTLKAKELTDTLAADDGTLPPEVAQLMRLRLEASKVSTKKLVAVKKCISPDNRVRGTLLYHGATPGRWAGKLVQPHNFPRGKYKKADQSYVIDLLLADNTDAINMLYPEPIVEAISFVLRGVIAAPKGRRLYVADYAAIEARGLVWAARQEDAVERYRQKTDQYKIMASAIFGVPVDSITDAQRKVGKDVILGCGYSMGVPKFMITCEERGAPVEKDIAEKGVYGYRDLHPKVVQFWYDVEAAAVRAVQNPGKRFRVGYVSFYVDGRFFFIQLPSGRRLAYPDPEVRISQKFDKLKPEVTFMGEQGNARLWVRQSTYGGKLVENIIQAISRDIMVAGMFNVEGAGYQVISTVHDEIISEADDGFGDVGQYEGLLCAAPEWARGFPVAAEGYTSLRWRK